ncbi:ricin-type beta-trefoil lectin domain protein [Streptomyces sp. NRRL S-350]|uniref:ricin-type beta-trefoil lectin domain protein n=1 Tax=Streptomyces sp. NRRL S-350 TaxID=1463902 RepID=UPI00131C33DC|nr:ricin-type beta-trefoil lectin domain protein [Streptomyces sp. NRRL S-350]
MRSRTFGMAVLPLAFSVVLSLGAGFSAGSGTAVAASADRNHGPADTTWPTPSSRPAKVPSDTRAAQIQAIRTAQAGAKNTGKPVVVDALTTGNSRTTANPDGTLTSDSTPVAERVKNADGTWRAVDATLRANPDGSVTPIAVPSSLSFSGGGSGLLATMATADGKKLSIKAPFGLPKPELHGASALYRSVMPDVDLELNATTAGGWRQVLVVRTAQAAADPKIKKLHLDTVADGLTVKADANGNLVAEDASGKARFTAPTPVMWDSTTTSAPAAAAQPEIAAKSAEVSASDAPAPLGPDSKSPGPGARTAQTAVTVSGTGIDLVPDASVLGQGTGPWYIDPGWNPSVDNGAQAWAQVQSAYPKNTEYNGTQYGQDKPGAGYCGYIDSANRCEKQGKERAYFQVGLNSAFWDSAVLGAKLYATVAESSSPSTATPMGLYSTGAGRSNPINEWTRWEAQPCTELSNCAKVGANWISGTGGKEYDVSGQMAQAAREHWDGWTFMFAPDDETNKYYHQRFDKSPHIVVTYDFEPHIGSPATSPTPGFARDAAYDQCQTPGTANAWDNPGWVGINTDINLSVDTWSPTGEQLWTAFKIWDDDDNGSSKLYETGWAASSGRKNASVGPLIDGHQYGWFAATTDDTLTSANSPMCFLRIDRTPPTARITSTDFPESGTLGGHPKHVGEDGVFTLSGTDPAPTTGGRSSGLACARWTTDPVQAAATGWSCNDDGIVKMDGNGSFQLTHRPTHWGTNFLYLQTQDNAGNMSQPVAYTYFVPSNPAAGDPLMGDIDGDLKADVLLPDSAGSLRLVGADIDPYAAPNTKPASAPGAAGNQDWSTIQITHRGSFSDRNVDDLVAHASGSAQLYLYTNDDRVGHLDGQAAVELTKSRSCALPDATTIDCAAYGNSGDWSAVTQIAAFGSPTGDTLRNPGTVTAGLPHSSLLFVEHGRLWLNLQDTTKHLDGPAILLSQSQDWDSYDLITPGPAKGTNVPTVWGRSKNDGTIHAYQLNLAPGNAFDASGFADPASGGFVGGVDTKLYPKVGSSGDVTGDGVPDLWAVDTENQLVVWDGVGTKAPDVKSGSTVTGLEQSPVVLGNLNRPIGNWLASPDGGNTVRDSQKRADGTASGVSWVGDTVDGQAVTVGAFSPGAGSNITMSRSVVDTRKSFTLSTWVKPGPASGVIASQDTVHGSNFMLYSGGTGSNWNFALAYADDDNWSYDYTTTVNANALTRTGVWTQLTASYNANTGLMSLYVDGTLAATGSHRASTSPPSSGAFTLGRYRYQSAPTASFDGDISSTAVYPFAVAPSAPSTAGVVRSGVNGDMCVDDNGAGTADGSAIQLYGCHSGPSQQLSVGTDGTIRVLGGCIAPVNSGTVNGTPLEYHTCDGTSAQKWLPLANGALYHPASGRCLDLPQRQATNGTRLDLSDCTYEANQQWSVPTLRSAVPPAPPRT